MEREEPQKREPLIGKHGGYRDLKSFQLARLIYDVTVLFCEQYVDKKSRTHDQMVQAARSGVQNIAEGSQASGTSKKIELKLTNVARASLEELRLDYEDYLRQRGLPLLPPGHDALQRFKARKCKTLHDVRDWVRAEHGLSLTDTDCHGQDLDSVRGSPCSSAVFAANGALSLLNLCCHLLDRQIRAQAASFETEGGFTERLYRIRSEARKPS